MIQYKTDPMKVCHLLILLLPIALAHIHTYKCVFDQNNQDIRHLAEQNVPEVPVVRPGMHLNGRLLVAPTTSQYGQLRIYLDYTNLVATPITAGLNGASTTTTTNLNFILNSLLVAQNFYQKRLRAGQLSSVTIPNSCVDFSPDNPGGTVANYDLLIFARYLTDKNIGYGATGKSCDFVSVGATSTIPDYTLQQGRPSVGRIIVNTYKLVDTSSSLTNLLFQSVTTTVLHEITHILGFDSTLYTTFLDSATGLPYNYTIRVTSSPLINALRPATSLLITPNVQTWARSYYNCSTLPGMPLENEDATGSTAGSHWQRAAIYDEMMTATSFGSTKGIFGVTFALLKDTGWYEADDSFSQTSNFGYQKGCSFVYDACYGSTSFSEFCTVNVNANATSYCQSTFYDKAVCDKSSAIMSDSCGVYGPYFSCVDPTSSDPGYQSYTSEQYGTNSFCVLSTLGTVALSSTMQSRCYPYVCNSTTSSITFTIGSYKMTCLSTQAGTAKMAGSLFGTLTCPSYTQFCVVSRKTCKNWCSKNGYCADGICNCNAGYYGSDCSISTCTGTQSYDPTTTSCVTSCPSGTYKNKYSSTCELCQSPCNQCSGTPTYCVSCVSSSSLQYFYLGVCYAACPNATFASGFNCAACDQITSLCLTCSGSATTCTSCMGSNFLSGSTCVASCSGSLSVADMVHKTCVASCPSYLLAVSSTCVFCVNGTYFYNNACQSNCSINGSSTYYADDTYHACMQCNSQCKTCDGPYAENCTSCLSTSGNPYLLLKMCWSICPKGFYANPTSGKCEVCPVQLSCTACKYNNTSLSAYCTSCIYGTFFFSTNSTCLTTCSTNQYQNTWNNSCTTCDATCATCNGPSSFSCLSCPGVNNLLTNSTGGYCLGTCPTASGYVKIKTTCQPCDSTCITCNGIDASQCSTCQSSYYLYNGYCRYICPSGTYPDSTTQQCLPCDGTCSYCFNGTAQSCTSCSGSLYLYNFTCSSTCPSGMSPNQWNVCFELLHRYSFLLLVLVLLSAF